MTTREELTARINQAEAALSAAKGDLAQFDSLAVNNQFDDLSEALSVVEEKLLDLAHEDCEGSYNCGADQYRQEFTVGGVTYVGILDVEYSRHDKTYYYVDGHRFRHEEIAA